MSKLHYSSYLSQTHNPFEIWVNKMIKSIISYIPEFSHDLSMPIRLFRTAYMRIYSSKTSIRANLTEFRMYRLFVSTKYSRHLHSIFLVFFPIFPTSYSPSIAFPSLCIPWWSARADVLEASRGVTRKCHVGSRAITWSDESRVLKKL